MFNVRCVRFTLTPATPPAAPRSPLAFRLSVFCFLLFVGYASAATRYVWQGSPSPGPPYDTWANAAHDIQMAVDAALAGDEIVVTNGIYATGGRAAGSTTTNRLVIDKQVTVRSVNGPQFTVIQGAKAPGGGNGDGAIRCVYLAYDAILSGFTLTNGATGLAYQLDCGEACGGGAYWGTLSNCVLTGNSAHENGGGAVWSTLNNCVLIGNSAQSGGGAFAGTLSNCTLIGNSADYGGGVYASTLNNCTLTGNWASCQGGGACQGCSANQGTLNNCVLTGNSADYGGGAHGNRLNNCVLTGNSARSSGGGAAGDGNDPSIMNNCTVTGNRAADSGGGVAGVTLTNCIVYFNTSPNGPNYSESTLNYCCTTPMPTAGAANITDDPQLASATYLSATSPCRGAGSAAYASGTDIDGEAWLTPPAIGCDEYHAGAVTGPLSVSIAAAYTNVVAGCEVGFTALIEGRTTASTWDFGDGSVVTNQPCATHAWATLGDYAAVLRAYNESYPGGVSATVMVHVVEQRVHYVAADSANPLPPYTSWATAATNIQDAVDAAPMSHNEILVSNGVYAAGGRCGSRLAVDKPLMLRSVNGPQFTIIEGAKAPGGTNGDGAIRCVYLVNGASLSGFTLTNGATRTTGGWEGRRGGGVWCESAGAVVSNCVLTGNSASESGGGAFGGSLNNCVLTGSSATHGGGAYGGTLNNSTLTGNSATYGAGACDAALSNCTLTGNSATCGGGAYEGTLNNCVLTGNSAVYGGGAYDSTLNNCTLTGNLAHWGGGVSESALNNCIVYFNTAPNGANYKGGTMNYCCTTPLPTNGVGSLDADPQLASATYLSANSPCRGAGSAAYASGTDIDGEAWATPPAIGCDEYHAGAVTGPLRVRIAAAYTNLAAGFEVGFAALIEGRASTSLWDFGDGTVVSNRPYAAHAWAATGDYAVVVRAYNESHPDGVSAAVAVHVVEQPVHYVAADSANPLPPYASWATAAKNIQDVVDVAAPGALVLVSNGVYASVTVDKPLTLRSVNGPEAAVIQGGRGRCVYLADGASLSGFTVTKGGHDGWPKQGLGAGGGVWCESTTAVVSNCVLTGNAAYNGGGAYGGTLNNCVLTGNRASVSRFFPTYKGKGGGACQCTLNNCTLIGNSATGGSYGCEGGGASECTLNNCTLTGNSANKGGGASACTLYNCALTGNFALPNEIFPSPSGLGGGACGCTLYNCIVYFNTAPNGANYSGGTLNYCCTTPMPSGGVANMDADPLFVNTNKWSGLRLQSNSPCINAGNNDYVTWSTDLHGMPRIVGGTVDMGAYEYNPNVAPVADASASRLLYISPNGVDAIVILDGSRSSDPDGDPLQYLWLSTINHQPSTTLATGVVAVVQLPLGIHPILLVVNDGLATATNTLTVEVITTAQAVQRLIGQVESSWPRSRPLVASLSAALRSIERGNSVPAIKQLQAFQHKVSAQVGPSEPTLAATFTATAQEIIEALSGGQTNPGGRPHGRLTATRHQPNGHVQLQFAAERGLVCIVEASTNLADWERIGIGLDHGDGTFIFDDPDAARFPNRFYRLVSP
jgi:parallel beta-helix repeat protein